MSSHLETNVLPPSRQRELPGQTRKWVGKDSIERHTTEIIGDELRVLHRASENKLQLTVHDDPPVENIFRQEISARPSVADTHTNGTPAA
jgi:hypothetical protein